MWLLSRRAHDFMDLMPRATRVHLAYPQSAFLRDYEKAYLPLVREELQRYGKTSWLVEDNSDRADLIILLQSAQYKTVEYIRVLENDELVRRHAERVYVIDYDDHPEGLLAGLYTSIEHPLYDLALHRSWPIIFMNNRLVYELSVEQIFGTKPQKLFSFTGAESHRVRTNLFALFSGPRSDHHVERIDRWYNHDARTQEHFVQVALESSFCLCPRGYASYTNRICEVMAMGRVPVIIADDWIPFGFEESAPYFVRVGEKNVEALPRILAAVRDKAEELGRNARMLWEKHCSPARRVVAAVEAIARFAKSPGRRPTFTEYRALWHSHAFRAKCGWTLRQRLALRMKQHAKRLHGSKEPLRGNQ
jgi:hypothetical protein